MAYLVDITSSSVSRINDSLYQITLGADVTEDSVPVVSFLLVARHNSAAPDFVATRSEFQASFIAQWDEWAAEQGILNSAALATMIGQIETGAANYTNS